jgi:hypothetical protein
VKEEVEGALVGYVAGRTMGLTAAASNGPMERLGLWNGIRSTGGQLRYKARWRRHVRAMRSQWLL